jgi:NodT family efflux transporter outer membrane factor (OMF) lipoprotein
MVLLGGCAAVGPEYARPAPTLPAHWRNAPPAMMADQIPSGEALASWWRQLNDAELTGLIERALLAAPDFRAALARLDEARARRLLAGAADMPKVTGSASAGASKSSEKSGSGARRDVYGAGLDAAWEADLFGGNRRGEEAAQADLEASQASLHAAQVSLAAEVALSYVELRGLQGRLRIARANLASQSETLQLTDWRAQAGLVTALEVEQARANVEQTRAQIPSLQTSLAEAEHRLAVLLGQAPGSLHDELAGPAPLPTLPPRVAVGIPTDTLSQRPDVRAAEHRLAAETARVGVAEAARYPGLTLSASIGLEALNPADLLTAGAFARSLVASLAGTVFDGGRLRQQVAIQNAVQEQALVGYETAVLTALEETENALVALANTRHRETALKDAVEAARLAALLARHRYTAGITDFQTVLNTERTLLSSEDSLQSAQAESVAALVRLYKALGGGWAPSPVDAPGNIPSSSAQGRMS